MRCFYIYINMWYMYFIDSSSGKRFLQWGTCKMLSYIASLLQSRCTPYKTGVCLWCGKVQPLCWCVLSTLSWQVVRCTSTFTVYPLCFLSWQVRLWFNTVCPLSLTLVSLIIPGEAVFARCLSSLQQERVQASKRFTGPPKTKYEGDKKQFIQDIRQVCVC